MAAKKKRKKRASRPKAKKAHKKVGIRTMKELQQRLALRKQRVGSRRTVKG